MQNDGQRGDVGELEGDLAVPARVDVAAVEWIMRPRRPSVDLPSSLPRMSSGTAMRSSVVPSTNWPGCRTNWPPSGTSMGSVSSGWSVVGSMNVCVELRKILKLEPGERPPRAGWTSARSSGSMTMRPCASSSLMSRSDSTIYITALTRVTPGTLSLRTRSMPCDSVTSESRAAGARTRELERHDAVVVNAHELAVAAVGLKARAHGIEHDPEKLYVYRHGPSRPGAWAPKSLQLVHHRAHRGDARGRAP